MWRFASHDQRSLKGAYETTLKNLLNGNEYPTSTGPADWRMLENLHRLIIQGAFVIETQRTKTYNIPSRSRHSDLPRTGFCRLADTCYKFLESSFQRHQQSGTNPRRKLSQQNKEVKPISDYALPNSFQDDVTNEEKRMKLRLNDVNLPCSTYISEKFVDLTRNFQEHRKENFATAVPKDLEDASKCLAGLITLTESQSFESLLCSVCFKKNQVIDRDLGLLILESILATNGMQDPAKGDFRNLSLAFGETTLLLAVRTRDADVVLALLRHGADVSRGWMGLENAIEVLLFSPNQILLGSQEIASIERCLSYLLLVMPKINMEALTACEREGYYPLHPDWRLAVRRAMEESWKTDSIPVPSLQHFCRCRIRESMDKLGHRINDGIHQLPLPAQLKQFIQL